MIDPIIGGAMVGAGASLLGNIFGFGSNSSANATNMKIAQMNNEFNERMMEKQMAYNTEMWEKNNEYNSAVNQRKRLEEAGLNPYMMMSGGNAGIAQNAGSVSAASSAGNPTMQAFRPDFSGLSQSINTAIQLKQAQKLNDAQVNNIEQQTAGLQIENKYKTSQIIADLAERYERTNNTRLKSDYQKLMNDTYMTMFNTDMQYKSKQMYLMEQQAEGYRIENLMKSETLKVLPQQLRANLAETLSRIEVNKADTFKKTKEAIKTVYESAGLKISNANLAAMTDDLLREQRARADEAEGRAKSAKAEGAYTSTTPYLFGKYLGSGSPLFSLGGMLGIGRAAGEGFKSIRQPVPKSRQAAADAHK